MRFSVLTHSIKSIDISVQNRVRMGLMLGGMHPGRRGIHWSPGLGDENSIGSTKTHAYLFKICYRAKKVVETANSCI